MAETIQDQPANSTTAAGKNSPFTNETSHLADLEERVQHLEDAVVDLCHTEQLEQKVASRVIDILQNDPLQAASSSRAEQAQPTSVQRAVPIPTAVTLAEYQSTPLTLSSPVSAVNLTSVMQPLRASMPLAKSVVNRMLPSSSIFRDIWWDFRIGYRMIRDPIYPMTLACKVIPLFAVFYITIWPWFSSWTGLIGTFMNGLVYILVFYIAYKVIHRELHRYYEFAVKYQRM